VALGVASQQLDLLDPVSSLCDKELPATSIFAFLHARREVLFPDALFVICGHCWPVGLRLGRANPGHQRSPVQPGRPPRRHGVAGGQLVHRVGLTALRVQRRGRAHRLRHPRRRHVL